MTSFLIGFFVGGFIVFVVMCIMNIAHQQSEHEDPTRRKANKPINETAADPDIWNVAAYIAECMPDKDVTPDNIINALFLCQAHYLAWTNKLLFPTYFCKRNEQIMLCDDNFMWSVYEPPTGITLKQYLMNQGNSEKLSETDKTDIELALTRHIHSDMELLVKENPVVMKTEDGNIIPYRDVRNSYKIEENFEHIAENPDNYNEIAKTTSEDVKTADVISNSDDVIKTKNTTPLNHAADFIGFTEES